MGVLASIFDPTAAARSLAKGLRDKPAAPAPTPEAPTRSSEEITKEKNQVRAKAGNRRGKSSTLLTTKEGKRTNSKGSGRKRLLGN